MSEIALAGLRLGRLERELLVSASRSDQTIGAYVNAPKTDPAVAAARLRAAHKLKKAGLLVLERIPLAGRVPDPRRERPFYEAGRSWLYADPARAQVQRRVAMWRTPLGDGVRIYCDRELNIPSARIRWDAARVEKIRRYAEDHPVPGNPQERMVAEAMRAVKRAPTLDEVEGRAFEITRRGQKRAEYFPDGVEDATEKERWREAVRAARRAHPNVGSAKLLAGARERYESADSDAN